GPQRLDQPDLGAVADLRGAVGAIDPPDPLRDAHRVAPRSCLPPKRRARRRVLASDGSEPCRSRSARSATPFATVDRRSENQRSSDRLTDLGTSALEGICASIFSPNAPSMSSAV